MVGQEEVEDVRWRKSSWSGTDGGCVSVAVLDRGGREALLRASAAVGGSRSGDAGFRCSAPPPHRSESWSRATGAGRERPPGG